MPSRTCWYPADSTKVLVCSTTARHTPGTGITYSGTSVGVFRSLDSGASYPQRTSFPGICNAMHADPANFANIYASKTGGSDATDYLLHAGSGSLVVEDFDLDKGDTLTVDKSLQGALAQAPDGHGGTLLSFGAKQGSVDLVNHASLSPSNIAFI